MPSERVLQLTDTLRNQVTEKRYLDVGSGSEKAFDVDKLVLSLAVERLLVEGFLRYYVRMTQHGSGKSVTLQVLTLPGITYKEVFESFTQL